MSRSKYLLRNIPKKFRNNWLSLLLSTSSMVTTTGFGQALQKSVMIKDKPSMEESLLSCQKPIKVSFWLCETRNLDICRLNVATNASGLAKASSPKPSKLRETTKYLPDKLRHIWFSIVVFPYWRALLMVKYSPLSISSSTALKRDSVSTM